MNNRSLLCALLHGSVASVFPVLLLSSACVPHYSTDYDEQYGLYAPQGQGAARSGDDQPMPPALEGQISNDRLVSFIAQLSDLAAPWGEAEQQVLDELNTYEARSLLQEAAMVVAVLRQYHHAQEVAKKHAVAPMFAEDDINFLASPETSAPGQSDTGEGELTAAAPSLREVAEKYRLNIAESFRDNRFLKSYEVQDLCLKVLKLEDSADPLYVRSIEAAIRSNLERWQRLGHSLAPHEGEDTAVMAPVPGGETPDDETTALRSPDAISPALPYDSSLFLADEELLREAQSLIEHGSYTESLALLQQIKADNLFYAAAQEKTRNAKNLAVQDLRKRAAKAFQSAIPVADLKARMAYLEEAKQLLEDALRQYPDAEQIETVKQNLRVINKNLDLLAREPHS